MNDEQDDRKHDEQDPAAPENGSADLTIPDASSPPPADEPDLDLRLRGDDPEPTDHGFDEPPLEEPPTDEVPTDEQEPIDEPLEAPPYESHEPPAYPYARAPLHHRLMRRPEGKVIAGVCSGLGAYTNTDPVLWRVGFVIFGLTSIGVLVYIVLWLVMPEARRGEPLPERPPHEAAQITRWAALAAIVLGCWVLFKGIFNIGGGWFWGLLLIGIGIAVWGRDLTWGRNDRTPDGPPFPPAPPPAPEPWRARQMSAAGERRADPATTPTPPANPATPSGSSATAWPGPRPRSGAQTTPLPPTRPPRYAPTRPVRRRESSYLGRLVVGACALAIGLGLVLNNTGIIDLTAKGLLSVLVGLVGAGLIVGAWAGRARWLIFPGLGLSVALLVSSLAPAFVGGSYGDVVWQPQSRKALLESYEHGAGQAVLDLTEVKFDEKPREVEVDVNFGELLVVIPEDVPVTSHAHVQGGEISNFGTANDGWNIRNTRREDGDEDIGRLTLDASVVFGELTIRRERPDDDFTAGTSNFRNGRDFRFNLGPVGVRGDR